MLDTTQVLPPELMDVRTSPEVIPPLHPVNASVTAHVALDPFAPAAPATIRNVAVAGIHEPAFQTPDWQDQIIGQLVLQTPPTEPGVAPSHELTDRFGVPAAFHNTDNL